MHWPVLCSGIWGGAREFGYIVGGSSRGHYATALRTKRVDRVICFCNLELKVFTASG